MGVTEDDFSLKRETDNVKDSIDVVVQAATERQGRQGEHISDLHQRTKAFLDGRSDIRTHRVTKQRSNHNICRVSCMTCLTS